MWRKTFMITSLCVSAIATFSAWALADPTRGPVKGAVGYSGGAVAAPVMLPDGSVSAPALTFTADTDIGIYRIGADIIGIAVNGALNATFDVVGLDLVGNLELTGGGSVVTTSDGDIVLAPNGSGVVDVRNAAVYVGDGTYSWDHSPTGFATEGSIEVDGLCSLDGGANFYDTNILNPSVLYQEAATSDVAAGHIVTEAGNPYHKATVNTDGANNLQCGGIGVKSMAVVQAGSAGSTITITTTDAVGTYTSTTLTLVSGAPGAGEIQCITSDAVCAAAIVAHLAGGALHVTAEAVATQVYLIPAATLCAMGLSSADGGGTKFVLTIGVDGQLLIGALGKPGSAATPGIAYANDIDTGFYQSSPNVWGFTSAGTRRMLFATALSMYVPLAMRDNYISSTAGTRINFPANEQTRFCNALQTQCFVLAATATDTVTLFDGAGTGAGNLAITGTTNSIGRITGSGSGVALSLSNPSSVMGLGGATTTDALLSAGGTHDQFVIAMGTDYGNQVVFTTGPTYNKNFDIAQETNFQLCVASATDPDSDPLQHVCVKHDQTDTVFTGASGDFKFLPAGGDFLLHETPTTDTAPTDAGLFAANAWSQASPGATSNGANLEFFAGVRKMALVCANPAISDQDEIVFTVNGVAQAALVESTNWDCFGETADQCCINLAAAIVTADYDITPDAVTLAGTVYLTPDEDLGTVDSIVLTDSIAADGHGITLTEGTDGSIVLSTSYGALTVTPTQVLYQDGIATTPSLSFADDTNLGFYRIGVNALGVSAGGVRVGSFGTISRLDNLIVDNTFEILNKTKLTSLGGDGIWEMGINAGTRGVRFDAATTADWLSLNDESGNDLTLAVGALVLSNGGTRSIYTSIVGANLQIGTSSGSSPFSTGAYTTYTGNQTHAGDYNSGTLTYCSTGTTNTDGNTGDCISQTGASGDGTGADAGNHIWNINGANEAMRIAGATGSATFAYESHFANNAAAATFGDVTTDADVVLAFDAVTNQGSLKYMEDEDEFDFGSSNISLAVNNNIGWSGYFLIEADSAADQVIFKVDSGVGNQIVITPGDESDDHGHAAAGGGNAVLYIHGDDIDDDATAWISATHDLTDGVVETGKGDLKLISAGGDAYIGTAAQGVKFDAATTDDILNLGTEAAATIGLRNVAGWWDLQADGDLILDNPGGTVNSPSLRLLGDDGGVEVEGGIYLTQGLDPYIRISVDNASDAGPPVLTGVLDIHDQVVAFVNDNATDIGAAGANRPKDLFLAGNAVVGGSTTGTSFIIGGNTLDTTEWGFLDGQDQDVSSDATGVAFGTASVTTTLTVPTGTDLPATCSQGEIFMDTNDDSCADDNAGTGTFCGCAATNVWEAFQ